MLIVIADVNRGVGDDDLPTYGQIPFKFNLPNRLEHSEWEPSGRVELRKPSATERYLGFDKSIRDRDPRIAVRFKYQGVLPSCVLSFKWRSSQPGGAVVVKGGVIAPFTQMNEREIQKAKREAKTPLIAVGSSREFRKEVDELPSAEWTTVKVPFEFGRAGLTSLDGTFTLSLGFTGSKYKLLIDDMQMEPLNAK